jgi:hypothetical protein
MSSNKLYLYLYIIMTGLALSLTNGCAADSLSVTSNSSIPNSDKPNTNIPATSLNFPIEVMGTINSVEKLSFNLSDAVVANYKRYNSSIKLYIESFGIDYQTEASIKINNSPWLSLDNNSVEHLGAAKLFGGFGGGFSNHKFYVFFSSVNLVSGDNEIQFRFNGTDKVSIGYRILDCKIIDENALDLLSKYQRKEPAIDFNGLDSSASAIAAGKTLWESAALVSNSIDRVPIQARCMDCHATNGFDLQYFNYTNKSIIIRSQFHGLTEDQGKKIASYIRSLPEKSVYGRPWNPPYQPGPGMDSRPISEWAAGAGRKAILDEENETYTALISSNIMTSATSGIWDLKKNLNVRETPLRLELPPWNHWLPRLSWKDYPKIANTPLKDLLFTKCMLDLSGIQSMMTNPNSFTASQKFSALDSPNLNWCEGQQRNSFWNHPDAAQIRDDNLADNTMRYALAQIRAVRMFEAMKRMRLEGQANDLYLAQHPKYYAPGNKSQELSINPRGWSTFASQVFEVAPHKTLVGQNQPELRLNGDLWGYFSNSWYMTAMILADNNNRRGDNNGVHWQYLVMFSNSDFTNWLGQKTRNNSLLGLTLRKQMESVYNTGVLWGTVGADWDRASSFSESSWYLDYLYDASRIGVSPQGYHQYTAIPEIYRGRLIQAQVGAFINGMNEYATNTWRRDGAMWNSVPWFPDVNNPPSNTHGPIWDANTDSRFTIHGKIYRGLMMLKCSNAPNQTLLSSGATIANQIWPYRSTDFNNLISNSNQQFETNFSGPRAIPCPFKD